MRIAIIGDIHIRDKDNTVRSRIDNYLETCLRKLETIADKHDYVIILGDVFHKHVVPIETINTIFYRLNKYKDKLYTILGNHDAFYRTENLDKTAIGLLSNMGIFKIVTDTFQIGDESFDVVSVVPKLEKPKNLSKYLLGHCYFEKTENTESIKESLRYPDLECCDYKYVFLGHEHTPMEPIKIGDTTLIRNGSLTRNDSSDYNLRRTEIYYSVLENGELTIEVLNVEAPELVFSPDEFNKPKKLDNKYNLENLSKFITNFGKKIDDDDKSTGRVLKTLNTPQTC